MRGTDWKSALRPSSDNKEKCLKCWGDIFLVWTENDSSGKYKPVDIIMFSFINFHFLFNRRKDGLTDGLLNNLVRYVIVNFSYFI